MPSEQLINQGLTIATLTGQTLFAQYLEKEAALEQQLQTQLGRIDAAGSRALDAINKI